MEFEPKNKLLLLKPQGSLSEKIVFIQKLYDWANDKINHFDRLRQQLLYFAFAIFSGLLAFVIQSDNVLAQMIACLGVSGLMVAFRQMDHRYHTFTHGFIASMFVFGQAIAYLLDNPIKDVQFYLYYTEGEKTVKWWSLQTKIYFSLAIITILLAAVIGIFN